MITKLMIKAAADVFCENGFEITCPWEADLDDVERGRYEALKEALEAALDAKPW